MNYMIDDSEFITRLTTFDLSEKEARLYLHLLKYGAEPVAVIAEYLTTYRKGVYRTLACLTDKGMVVKSISKPAVYAALPLDTTLDTIVRRSERGLQQKIELKQELSAFLKAMETIPPALRCSYRVLVGPKEVEAASRKNIKGAIRDLSGYLWGNVVGYMHESGELDLGCDAVRRGVRVRLITEISQTNLAAARYALDCGIQVRHVEQTSGINFTVRDFKDNFVVIRFDPSCFPLEDMSIAAFVCESPTYVKKLLSNYELEWEHACDGTERIRELAKEAP